jgi:hydrogenase maturation protease
VSSPRQVVIGVGNEFRHDDGAGLAVAARLGGRVPTGVAVVSCEQESSRLLEAFDGVEGAVVVDAIASGAAPGTLHRFDVGERPLPVRVFRSSTHAFGVGETIELARALGSLPQRLLVYGIEGSDFGAGRGLSTPVQAAVESAVRAVLDDLEEGLCTSAR